MTAPSPLDRARRYVEKAPPAIAGQGGHNQTFAVACALVNGFALSESEALALLAIYNQRCDPPWTERELTHKIKSALAAAHSKPQGHLIGGSIMFPVRPYKKPAPPPPALDPATAVENYLKGFRCAAEDIIAASPYKIPPLIRAEHFHRQGAYMLDVLFEPGELVNIVTKAIVEGGKARPGDAGQTMERNAWEARLLDPKQPRPGAWLRMNPLDGKGVTDANVTAYRHALVEIDCVPLELQLALLARLRLPISAILLSGGKSAHAWVRMDASSLDEYRRAVGAMLALLARFGVDGKNKNPSRLSRLPGIIRTAQPTGDGKQQLLYLNPCPKQEPIL